MPHFTLPTVLDGPIVDAVIDVSANRANALRTSGVEAPQKQTVRLLVDTGASGSSLDPSILRALRIQPTGIIQVHTSTTGGRAAMCNQYDVSLRIPSAAGAPFAIENLAVSEHDFLTAHNIHGLLGRDVLRYCIFMYNGQTKQFTLAY